MTTRLTAKDAARKAELKRVELDAKKSADKDAAKLAKQIDRQWNLQKLACIREALGGNSYVDIKKKLIRPSELKNLGFSFCCVDVVATESEKTEREQAEAERQESLKNEKSEALGPLEDKVFEAIDGFIAEHKDGLKSLFGTVKKATMAMVSCVEEYKAQKIADGYVDFRIFESFNALEDLEDSEEYMFEYEIGVIEDAVDRLLEKKAEFDPDSEDDYQDDDDDEGSEEFLIKRTFNAYHLPEVLEIDHPDNFFRIEWQSKSRYARWQFDQIFSEETLAWLCSETGQAIFNLIQAEIESAIEDGKSSVVLQSRSSGVASLIEIRGETHPGAPQPEQMEYLIKALDFQCNVSDGESGRSRIEISW